MDAPKNNTNARSHIYLDQQKWIDLARAYHGRPNGADFRETLDLALSAVDDDRAIFPISGHHFIETAKQFDKERRKRLAEVMVRLSKCTTITSGRRLVREQVRAGIHHVFGSTYEIPDIPIFGRGVLFAFEIEYPASSSHPIHQLTAHMTREFLESAPGMRDMLVAPDEDLRLAGTSRVIALSDRSAKEAQANRQSWLDHEPDVRRRAYLGCLFMCFGHVVETTLMDLGKSITDLENIGHAKICEFIEFSPPLDVETELSVQRNDHQDRKIDPNDDIDIAHLTMGIPYCDALVTERFWCDLAKRRRLSEKYRCLITHDVRALNPLLTTD